MGFNWPVPRKRLGAGGEEVGMGLSQYDKKLNEIVF